MRVTRISSAVSSKNHPEITDPQSQSSTSHQLRHITRTGLCITLDLFESGEAPGCGVCVRHAWRPMNTEWLSSKYIILK